MGDVSQRPNNKLYREKVHNMPASKEELHTVEYIASLPENEHVELLDGVIYNLAAPSRIHQKISFSIARIIADHIDRKSLPCEVYPAPFAVFLDEYNYFEPDISIICDRNRLSDRGCEGAPDWIIEIVSPSSASMDYLKKLNKYQATGVRLYWIVNPVTKTVSVYEFENDKSMQYPFSDPVPVSICDGFQISVADALA